MSAKGIGEENTAPPQWMLRNRSSPAETDFIAPTAGHRPYGAKRTVAYTLIAFSHAARSQAVRARLVRPML
jgi:hypothetical protein